MAFWRDKRVEISTVRIFAASLAAATLLVPAHFAGRVVSFTGEPWGMVEVDGHSSAAIVPHRTVPNDILGKPIVKAHPGYPTAALAEHAVGTIVLEARVSKEGFVDDATVRFGGHPALEKAALSADTRMAVYADHS